MNDQPREEKVPEGAGQPTVEQPTAETAGQMPGETAAQPTPAVPGDETTVHAQPPAAPGQGETAVHAQPPAAPGQGETVAQPSPGEVPNADQTAGHGQPAPGRLPNAVHGRQPPPTPQLSQPGPGQAYGAWGPPAAAPRQPGGFRRFVGHRATQLVGVGVLGVLIGGGVVGGIALAASHHGPQDGRPGIHRQHNGQVPDGRGFPGRGGGNSGNSGNTGSGGGI
ncbi:hypothetical protein GCM10027258_16810 [Amycolatopsis stemonae]